MKRAVWITEAEVAALIDMGDAIEALERGSPRASGAGPPLAPKLRAKPRLGGVDG
jgi:hypothetical protein